MSHGYFLPTPSMVGRMTLLDKLEAAGLDVWAHPDWETASNDDRDRVETVGILNHWDAISGWPGDSKYLSTNRFGGILYHVVVRDFGQVRLYSQRYVWHAGSGSSQILNIAQSGGEIPVEAAGPDNQNGNPHFFGVCINYHPNQGPVPDAQYKALVVTNRVLIDHFGLNVGQVARHMDWTTRKRDIDTIDLAQFRADISQQEDEVLPIDKNSPDEDIRFIQGLVGVRMSAQWDADTIQAVADQMGQYTNNQDWKAGNGVGGAQLSGFLKDLGGSSGAHDHDGEYLKDVRGVT